MVPNSLSGKVFLLLLILLFLVYYVGFVNDAGTLLDKGGNFIDKLTGRNPQTGQFAGYAK